MRYPENLKIGDTIGICAPSDGIIIEEKIARLDEAISNLESMGFKVIETASVRKSEKGRSTTAKKRAEEFMSLYEDPNVKMILYAGGGDFLIEMLDFLDWEKLRKLPPKWTQGFSDITGISFLLNTILEIPSMYCESVKDYAMDPLYPNLLNALLIEQGKEIMQTSFEEYEIANESTDPKHTYNLTEKVEWKNLTGESEITMKGRALGGCFDVVQAFFGTEFDQIREYIQKYKEDGIIWFLECYEMTSAEVLRKCWQMKHAGYFEKCKGIIFGRPLIVRQDYDISFNEAVKEALGDLDIPIIVDADIGHVPPQLAVVNGAILEITSKDGKGSIKTYLK